MKPVAKTSWICYVSNKALPPIFFLSLSLFLLFLIEFNPFSDLNPYLGTASAFSGAMGVWFT